jgi:hypothetical protein
MLILSPHRVSERGKVVYLKFVLIFGQNGEHLIFFKNIMHRFLSTLQCDHGTLSFIEFGCDLREQLSRQFLGGSDARNSRPEL